MSDKLLSLAEVQERIAGIQADNVTQGHPYWLELEALYTAEAALIVLNRIAQQKCYCGAHDFWGDEDCPHSEARSLVGDSR